jgi:predicted dehydrogenase
MSHRGPNRRQFLQTAAAAGAATITPYWFTSTSAAQETSKNDRHVIGCIGTGDRWRGAIGPGVKRFGGEIVAVCDVDKNHVENNGLKVAGEKADTYEDYRRILDRKDIDIVTVVTPDHWHSKILIEAMQAGKDVYCEKPMTLTIDEGKKICQVQKQTGRVVQVGTQQRDEFQVRVHVPEDDKSKAASDSKDDSKAKDAKAAPAPMKTLFDRQFLQVVALAHAGRLGKIKTVTCSIGGTARCPDLPKVDAPDGLNWELWQGQAPLAEYVQGTNSESSNHSFPASRCHYEFRWWYEYSGGKLTDWGAHHVDIAQWAIGMDHSGPTSVEVNSVKLPMPFENGYPTVKDRYNTAQAFNIKFQFPNGVELIVRDGPSNGIWLASDDSEVFVSRNELKDVRGTVIADLANNPIPEDDFIKLCKGKKLPEHGTEGGTHMRNFIECVHDRSLPISDVFTHHRALTTCHLANIAIRLNRPLKWDPEKEEFVGDSDANSWLAREQRKGYEIKV